MERYSKDDTMHVPFLTLLKINFILRNQFSTSERALMNLKKLKF